MDDVQKLIDDYKNQLEALKQMKKNLEDSLKSIITNKTIPLNDRWDLFITGNVGYERNFIEHWESLQEYCCGSRRDDIEESFVHNGDVYNRYETIDVQNIYNTLEDELEMALEYTSGAKTPPEWYNLDRAITNFTNSEDEPFSLKALDEFREEILRKFIRRYKFDW